MAVKKLAILVGIVAVIAGIGAYATVRLVNEAMDDIYF